MPNYIPRGARRVLESDTTRAIAATAVGEAIRRVGTTRNKATEAASSARVPAAGGFAVGAGATTVALVAARKIGRLISKPQRPAVLDFTSKLGSAGSGTRRSANATSRSKPTGASAKRTGASSGQKPRAKATRSSGASSGRSRSVKSARTANGSASARSAKSGQSSNGSAKSPSAKSSRSSNGAGAKKTSAKRAAKPAGSRRS